MKRNQLASSPIVTVLAFAVMAFLFLPILVTFIVSFNSAGFVLPPGAPTLKWYQAALSSPQFLNGMVISLVLALTAAVLGLAIGGMAAVALTRFRPPGRELILVFLMSPLLVPTTILGLALYIALVRAGGGEGFLALLCGHTLLVLPFAVRLLTSSLVNVDRSLEEAARMSGAGAVHAFFFATVPVIKAGIFSAFVICFVMSWNDFSITIFLAGKGWVPLPIEIFSYIKFQYDPVGAAIVCFIIFVSLVTIYIVDRVVGIASVFGSENKG